MTDANAHIAIVCQTHGISKADLLGPRKLPHHIKPRKDLFHRLIVQRGLSLYQSARLGKKHHTTGLKCARQYSALHFGTSMSASLKELRAVWGAHEAQKEIAA